MDLCRNGPVPARCARYPENCVCPETINYPSTLRKPFTSDSPCRLYCYGGDRLPQQGVPPRSRWLFRMNESPRQSHFPLCASTSLDAAEDRADAVRSYAPCAEYPRGPTPHTPDALNFSLHDVFVDNHGSPVPFDPSPDDFTQSSLQRPAFPPPREQTSTRAPCGVGASVCFCHRLWAPSKIVHRSPSVGDDLPCMG